MNETEKKICPLLALSPSVQLNAKTYCIGDRCAWWNNGYIAENGSCFLASIGKALQSIGMDGLTTHQD